MTQKFYLLNLQASDAPTAGEKAVANPKYTLGANNAIGTEETRYLGPNIGSSFTNISKNSDATTSTRSNYMGRFTSEPLAAQTFGSGTWTIAIELNESNANADSFMSIALYVWRPGTSSVVGQIYDNNSDLGTEWAATRTGKVQTFSGSDITIQDGDVLVLEIWRQTDANGQAMATAYSQNIYYNGGTDVTVGSTTAGGSYLLAPADITTLAGGGGGDVFFEGLHRIESGMKAATAAEMDGVLVT